MHVVRNGLCRSGFVLILALAGAGCGGEGTVTVGAAPSGPTVTQRSVAVASVPAPANPITEAAAPSALNQAYAQVYQRDDMADADIEKVLVLMPGFLGGAGNFAYLAQRMVERSGGKTAVWTVDRRSNGLEDQTGFDAAEAAKDPDVAKGYYFGGASVDGKTFAGLLDAAAVSFLSEWGIRVHVEDLDALIQEADRRYPRAAIFLGGHSLGASIVPIYAAWDFGGRAGFERLSGIVLLEGGPNPTADTPSQQEYEFGGINGASVDSIRNGDPTSGFPFVGPDIFLTLEVVAMRASNLSGQATALSPDADLYSGFFGLLFGLTPPPMTNEAALGFGMDNDFQPFAFSRVSMGLGRGPLEPNPNAELVAPGEGLLRPADADTTYQWDGTGPSGEVEPTDLRTFARTLFAGPSNYAEWYFPARLSLDVRVTANLNVQPTGDWRKDVYGLAVTENGRVDVPVFAVGGSKGLLKDLTRLEPYRQSIAPALRDGQSRTDVAAGFQTRLQEGYVHLDVLAARDDGEGNGEFAALTQWMDEAVHLAPPP